VGENKQGVAKSPSEACVPRIQQALSPSNCLWSFLAVQGLQGCPSAAAPWAPSCRWILAMLIPCIFLAADRSRGQTCVKGLVQDVLWRGLQLATIWSQLPVFCWTLLWPH